MLLNRPITAIILILAAFIFGSLALNELSGFAARGGFAEPGGADGLAEGGRFCIE